MNPSSLRPAKPISKYRLAKIHCHEVKLQASLNQEKKSCGRVPKYEAAKEVKAFSDQ